jgi:RHS repeat-associated protein
MTLPANVRGYQASETYEYDRNASGVAVAGRGLVTKITHADGTYRSFGYDAYGNKLWEENELRQRTTYTYDAYKRLLSAKNPLNQMTTYSYEATNGPSSSPNLHTNSSVRFQTTPTGIKTANVYDENFRKTSTTQAHGTGLAATTTFTYDNVGNLTQVTDPLNHTTTTTYDSRNRKKTVTDTLNQITTFYYDFASNVIRIDRPGGTMETKTYDALNRVLANTVPQIATVNLTTWFTYNPSVTIASVKDPKLQVTTFSYDASDQKIKMTYPGGTQSQSWTYDAAHNLASRTTVGGKTQSFGYDGRNRKQTMVWSNQAEWTYFAYDAASRLVTAKNGTGTWNTNIISTVTRSYDTAGRLIQERQQVTGLTPKYMNYYYDADGKQRRLYASDGYDYTFGSDVRGRLQFIFPTGNSNALFQYSYDAASNEIQRFNWPNRVAQIYTRDSLDRVSRLDLEKDETPLSADVYTYDRMSRVTGINRWPENKQDQFGYYLNGELYWTTYGTPALNDVTYVLDKAGNRTGIHDGGVVKYYMPNTLNQYTAAEGDTVTNGSEHEITSYQNISYTYINDERLSRIATSGVNYWLYYDALGRCVKRIVNGVTTHYIYDGEKPVLEYNSGGAIIARNVYGKWIDEILMRTETGINGGQPFYYQQDRNWNVTHLTNASGAVIEKYRYDAFGAPRIYNASGTQLTASAYKNRFLFTGREYAPSILGFYEYRARAYHPVLGRFMSEDPKGFDAGDYNLFRYCHNDPLDRVDPMGLGDESVNAKMVQLGSMVNLTMHVGSHIPTRVAVPVFVPAAALVELRASYAKTNEQKLSQLSPLFAPMARHFVSSANQELNPEGYEVRITNDGGYRSFAEQAELRRKYETGGPRANRPGESAHNYGAAIDVAIIKGSRLVEARKGSTEYQGLIGRVGNLGERQGLVWGGHFSRPDPPHFQYPGIPVNGRDMLRLHYTLMSTLGVGLNTMMGVP